MTRDWSVCRFCHDGYHSDCHEPQCNCQIHLAPVAMENLGQAIQLIKASQEEIARGIREGGEIIAN